MEELSQVEEALVDRLGSDDAANHVVGQRLARNVVRGHGLELLRSPTPVPLVSIGRKGGRGSNAPVLEHLRGRLDKVARDGRSVEVGERSLRAQSVEGVSLQSTLSHYDRESLKEDAPSHGRT